MAHVPVLYQPIIEYLAPHPGGRYIDATLGAGGHAAGILDASAPDGRLLGLDADPAALSIARENLARFGERVMFVHSNFEHLREVAAAHDFIPADGIVLDIGLSSMQLADAARGFSFASEGALDMRFNPDLETTAADLVNSLDEAELADLIFEYGEEHASRRIARAIVYARPITTAAQLAAVIEKSIGRRGGIHPATRTFQALRIAVNRELQVLEHVLPQIVDVLAVGGRIALIAFHSLEDRIVKNYFRSCAQLHVLTKHPLQATREEELANPRSRSAKLRVAERRPPP
ncbi:MAG: 16S rRNA (cytosine(1402)-N(4))-methyltransferase RsmH [Chloroflexi bacterium]|nr:16S rRNA (cytosine(1402)-N(4))-methyltransferase RsmH [Chloroflexota bacterium]